MDRGIVVPECAFAFVFVDRRVGVWRIRSGGGFVSSAKNGNTSRCAVHLM